MNIFKLYHFLKLTEPTIVLIPYIRESNFSPSFSSYATTTSAITANISNNVSIDFLKALVIVYLPIAGFEICAIPAEETKGEQKTAIKSMRIVMGVVILIYIHF